MTEELTRINIDLPNHWAVGGEAMWAKELGGNLYQLENVPFYAYDLNYGDTVEAVPKAVDQKPSVVRVVERSGHQTIRVMFDSAVPEDTRLTYLNSLADLNVSFEGLNPLHFALDLEPNADIGSVRERLDAWEAQGVAEYETCESRVPGSFDDAPAPDNQLSN